MFDNAIESIKYGFNEYKGSGAYFVLFAISLIIIFYIEKKIKKSNNKEFLFTFSIIIFLIIICPIFAKFANIIYRKNIYGRLFWMLPLGVVIAYTATYIISTIKKKNEKIILSIILIGIISLSGKNIYTSENFTKADNYYKLNQEAIDMVNFIKQDNTVRKKVIPPVEFVAQIRQIDADISVMYARNPQGYADNSFVMNYINGDIRKIIDTLRDGKCNYIIYSKQANMSEKLKKYSFYEVISTENYVLYRNDKIN